VVMGCDCKNKADLGWLQARGALKQCTDSWSHHSPRPLPPRCARLRQHAATTKPSSNRYRSSVNSISTHIGSLTMARLMVANRWQHAGVISSHYLTWPLHQQDRRSQA
jgi:hypothetical protein